MGALDRMWENSPSNDGNCNYPTYVDPKNDTYQPNPEPPPDPPSSTSNDQGSNSSKP